MKTNVYVFFDKIADDAVYLAMAKTDGLVVRNNLASLARYNSNYMNDCEVRCIGEYVDSECTIIPFDHYRVVDWNSYTHPEQPVDIKPEKV